MTTFILIVLGIFIGWITPRPYVFDDIEHRIWAPIKKRIPYRWRWWI